MTALALEKKLVSLVDELMQEANRLNAEADLRANHSEALYLQGRANQCLVIARSLLRTFGAASSESENDRKVQL